MRLWAHHWNPWTGVHLLPGLSSYCSADWQCPAPLGPPSPWGCFSWFRTGSSSHYRSVGGEQGHGRWGHQRQWPNCGYVHTAGKRVPHPTSSRMCDTCLIFSDSLNRIFSSLRSDPDHCAPAPSTCTCVQRKQTSSPSSLSSFCWLGCKTASKLEQTRPHDVHEV